MRIKHIIYIFLQLLYLSHLPDFLKKTFYIMLYYNPHLYQYGNILYSIIVLYKTYMYKYVINYKA